MLLNPLASVVCFPLWFPIVVSICLRSAVRCSIPSHSPSIELFCCQACVSCAVSVLVCVCLCVCLFLWRRHLALHLAATFFSAVCFPVSSAYIFKTNHKKSYCAASQQQNHPLPGKPTHWAPGVGGIGEEGGCDDAGQCGRQEGDATRKRQLFVDWQRRRADYSG